MNQMSHENMDERPCEKKYAKGINDIQGSMKIQHSIAPAHKSVIDKEVQDLCQTEH